MLNLSGAHYEPAAIRMHFTRNLPGMPEEAAEMAQKLSGILSRKTVIEHLPMVEDAEAEMARIASEEISGEERKETDA